MTDRRARSTVTVVWPKGVAPTEPAFLTLHFAEGAGRVDRSEIESDVLQLLDELSQHGGMAGGTSFVWRSDHHVECTMEGLMLPGKASTWLETRLRSRWPTALAEVRLYQELAPVPAAPARAASEARAALANEVPGFGAFEPIALRHPDTRAVLVSPCIEIMMMAAGKNAVVRAACREFGARWLSRFPETALLLKGGDHKAYRASNLAQGNASWASHFDAKNRRVQGALSLAAGKSTRAPEPPTLGGLLVSEGTAVRGCLPIAWASRPAELAAIVDELFQGLDISSGWCGISQYLGPDDDADRWLEDEWGPLRGRGCPSYASWIRDFPGITVGARFVYEIWANEPYLLHVGWITLVGRDFAQRTQEQLAALESPVEMATLPGGVVRLRTGAAPNAGGTIDDGSELRTRESVGRALQLLRPPDDLVEHFSVGRLSDEENRAYCLRFFGV
ncbi:Hypothetical protein A7982_02009 [Minicystis rosea]|nr:Hypothetical protein A7982_02009 [Minicystis rosea]